MSSPWTLLSIYLVVFEIQIAPRRELTDVSQLGMMLSLLHHFVFRVPVRWLYPDPQVTISLSAEKPWHGNVYCNSGEVWYIRLSGCVSWGPVLIGGDVAIKAKSVAPVQSQSKTMAEGKDKNFFNTMKLLDSLLIWFLTLSDAACASAEDQCDIESLFVIWN